jgi:hypothetical protein
MSGMLALFDLGKTNSELFVFAPGGTLPNQRRTRPMWRDFGDERVECADVPARIGAAAAGRATGAGA